MFLVLLTFEVRTAFRQTLGDTAIILWSLMYLSPNGLESHRESVLGTHHFTYASCRPPGNARSPYDIRHLARHVDTCPLLHSPHPTTHPNPLTVFFVAPRRLTPSAPRPPRVPTVHTHVPIPFFWKMTGAVAYRIVYLCVSGAAFVNGMTFSILGPFLPEYVSTRFGSSSTQVRGVVDAK